MLLIWVWELLIFQTIPQASALASILNFKQVFELHQLVNRVLFNRVPQYYLLPNVLVEKRRIYQMM
jgi:hypothetical protein